MDIKNKQLLKINSELGTCLGSSFALKSVIEQLIDGYEVDNKGVLKEVKELCNNLEKCLNKYNDLID